MSEPTTTAQPGASAERKHWIELSELNWPLIFLFYTVLGLVTADGVYTSGLAEYNHNDFLYPLLWEMTGHWTVFLLAPLIVLAFSRLPIRRQNWTWTVPSHIGISAGLGVMHTLMMYSSRRGVYEVLGLGSYDYGHLGYRFLMEYHKQALNYWGVYLVLRAVAHFRDARVQERKTAALELKTAELQKQLAQAQLDSLRSQLNPHFLFNTLNMVSSVMYEDVGRADQMIGALSQMLRLSLEPNVPPRVPVRRELEFVNCALELARARFQERLDVIVACSPEAVNALVPTMLVYTFIENSMKHHDFERDSTIHVQANLKQQGECLVIEVSDNGPGIESPEKAFGSGVGLTNTRARLRALFGEQQQLQLMNLVNGGLRVSVTIPFELADQRPADSLLCSARAPAAEKQSEAVARV